MAANSLLDAVIKVEYGNYRWKNLKSSHSVRTTVTHPYSSEICSKARPVISGASYRVLKKGINMTNLTIKNRSLVRSSSFCAVLLAALCAFPTAALPCSVAFSLERYGPPSGTVVPTNAVLYLSGPTFTDLVVTSSNTPNVPMTLNPTKLNDESLWALDHLIQIPVPGLVANQSVTIQLEQNGFPNTTETIALTTSTDADTTPPVITDTPTLSYDFREAQPPSGCHPWDHFRVVLESDGATDDFGVAAYGIYEEVQGGRKLVQSEIHNHAGPTEFRAFYVTPDEGQRCFSLIAFDMAGNTSAPQTTCIQMQRPVGNQLDAGTVPSSPDGGVVISVDGGAVVAQPTTESGGFGCATSRDLNDRSSLVFCLLVLGGMLIQRRKKAS